MSICRLCLCADGQTFVSVWDNEDLPVKIFNYVAINITKDDNLPSTICFSCLQQITIWEKFRNDCLKSNELLLKATSKDVKSENVTIYIFDDNLISNDKKPHEILKDKVDDIYSQKIEVHEYKDDIDYLENEFLTFAYKNDITDLIYECEICTQEFDNCFEYLDHQKVHNGEPVFECDKCSNVYNTREELVAHDRNHRSICPHCGKSILKTSMSLHLIKHTDKFKCDQCGGCFNSKAALCQHVITVHTDRKDHICDACGKRFSSQTAMKVHMKSHSDKRLYPCKLCGYAGRTASAIYVHMSTHANDVCVCEVCSKTFKSTRNLNDHLRRVHAKEKKHQCTYCNKKFVDKYMLSVHMRCHTGVRPYHCTFCEKSFIRSDGLKEHIAIHGQRVLYECNMCNKKFTSKRGVTRHNCAAGL